MYLGIDGGGSRLRLLLVDSELRVIRFTEGPGVNTNFTPEGEVRRIIEDAVEACLPEGLELDGVAMMVLGAAPHMEQFLRRWASIRELHAIPEGAMGLMAGLGRSSGFLALSGTGSDVFFMDGNRREVIGGWGLLLGDEGSGTDVGQMGLKAAIKAHEGWGAATLLLELLLERWKLNRADLMRQMCDKVYAAVNPRGVVASFALCVGEAARNGDPVAMDIYRSAGNTMALQMSALLQRVSGSVRSISDYGMTLSGSTWKGSWHMFRSFSEGVHLTCPDIRILWPGYDAIAGAIAHLAAAGGMGEEDLAKRMAQHLGAFRFERPEDWPE